MSLVMKYPTAESKKRTSQRHQRPKSCNFHPMAQSLQLVTRINRLSFGTMTTVWVKSTLTMLILKSLRSFSLRGMKRWQRVTITTSWTSTRCGPQWKSNQSTIKSVSMPCPSPAPLTRSPQLVTTEAFKSGTSLAKTRVRWLMWLLELAHVLTFQRRTHIWSVVTRMVSWGCGTLTAEKFQEKVAKHNPSQLLASKHTTKVSTSWQFQKTTWWLNTTNGVLTNRFQSFSTMTFSVKTAAQE